MAADAFLRYSPLISVGVWFALSGYLIRYQRYRTWTERWFLGLCLSVAAYAVWDVVFFQWSWPLQPSDLLWARIEASLSVTSITLAGLFLYLYGLSLVTRFRGLYLLAILPTAFFIVLFPIAMFPGFQPTNGAGSPVEPVYSQTWLVPWLVWVGALWIIGVVGVAKTFFEVRPQNRTLANRIAGILVGLAIAVVAGGATNALIAVLNVNLPPLFSTFLTIPGVLIGITLNPASVRSLNDIILRRRASEYDVKGAFLTFSDGTLIGSRTVPGEQMIDADSFSATLDVIQNFMRTSFPTLRGRWLKSIHHGEYTLVLERGRFAYLTLIISGTENDRLRQSMIDHLEGFEAANGERLENWRGMAADAVGVESMLDSLLSGPGVPTTQA